MSQNDINYQHLVAEQLPLQGTHLIEASAGTGKTYNITRLYLRMLLERKLPVEKILVMTFTKDATQELKGRIDSAIRDALNNWQSLCENDVFFKTLAQRIEAQEAQFLLQKALLFLDEAAIFTIHGFCQRVLSEHAFSTQMSFNAALETDLSELTEKACQDWYRILAKNSADDFLLLARYWDCPAALLSHFNKAIAISAPLSVLALNDIEQAFIGEVSTAISALKNDHNLLEDALINTQKGQKKDERIAELNELQQWLLNLLTELNLADDNDSEHKNDAPRSALISQVIAAQPPMPTAFFHGNRYSRTAFKEQLLNTFTPLKTLKNSLTSIVADIEKAQAYEIVRQGIYYIRQHISEQKTQQHLLGFDDLISNLADALSQNDALVLRVREQYPVALVDEFQDTDPQQFTILSRLYPQGASQALFMIGDPKQAIYGFRGGDVFAYLSARMQCDQQWLMDTNWRSSALMIQGYNRLFNGVPLDQAENTNKVFGYNIPYLPVKASSKAKAELNTGDNFRPLQFVHFDSVEHANKNGQLGQSFRPQMAIWCANEITRLLMQTTSTKALQPKDIAILVRDGTEAKEIKQALEQQGLACVYLSNRSDLFQSAQAQQIFLLLRGILFNENESYYSQGVTCALLGFHAEAFYQLQQNEQEWQNLKETFANLRKHWQKKGFMSMALKLMHEHFCLTMSDKDRVLTNVLHLFELLQTASQRHRQPHELLFWLEQHIAGEGSISETELRLESDDDLIKIVTQHGSKGLEYPVVFVPYASRYKNPLKLGNRHVHLIEYHDQQGKLQLSLDASIEAKAIMTNEQHAETIRLLYVAITRAEQRCYLLTANFEQVAHSPLGKTLKLNDDSSLVHKLQELAQELPNAIGLTVVDDNTKVFTNVYQKTLNNLDPQVSKFTSKIERDWWLSSFTALAKDSKQSVVSRPDRDGETLTADNSTESYSLSNLTSVANINNSHLLQFNLSKGAHTGNFLHEVLEHTHFSQPNWQQSLKLPLQKYRHLLTGYDETQLIQWLEQILHAPLGKVPCLASISANAKLTESEFYFPMADTSIAQLANLLTDHRKNLRSADPTLTTPAAVNLPKYRKLKGMMHGFIDLVFQVEGKFYVCDYKSSYLGDDFPAYQHQTLTEHIEYHYYDLQYLLYSLALHRYLQASLPDYQAERDFGGVYYLYLRGMTSNSQYHQLTSANKPSSTGVYYQNINEDLLTRLDNLFSAADQQQVQVSSAAHINNKEIIDEN